MHMPTPRPRHLARARRPWRLLLVAFGFTTAVLAALVASATLLPQPEPPRRAPGVALPTVTTEPARPSTSFTTTQEPATAPSPPTSSPDTTPSAASRPIATAGRRSTADAPLPSDTIQPPVTTPSTAPEPTMTAPTTTAVSTSSVESTTTLLTTTSAEPTTTGPTTTSTDPTTTTTSIEPTTTRSATTTTSPMGLGGSQPAGVSAATVGGLVPLLGLLYLLRGLLPRPGGTHAKRRPTNRARRD